VDRIGASRRLKGIIVTLVLIVSFVVISNHMASMSKEIESTSGWGGGLGLPVLFGWAVAGVVAAIIAWAVGKICLGLRSDYLAIATLGIAAIIKTFLKNADWLTRGTLTVSPLPWPVPATPDYLAMGDDPTTAFTYARGGYLLLMVVIIALVIWGIERAYHGPWGRMMRAIRDNYIAASSMGKDVTERQLQLFVLGSVLMGLGGAILATYTQLFDPSGYQPINHTFLVWVMVIVGGAGNSFGALFGAVFIYLVYSLSDPVSHALFDQLSALLKHMGWPEIPDVDSRASQMRVFVLGLVITLALRYAPRGLIPELIRREK
jgi:branched-chain amino acid transport system permease protein